MKSIAILGDGCYPRKAYPLYVLDTADVVICCDGAFVKWLRHSHSMRQLPDAVIGDLDSLPASLRRRYPDIMVHVDEQENNDQTKALIYALEHFCNDPSEEYEIHFIGASGRREDHTVGNMSLMMEYERRYHLSDRGIRAQMLSDWTVMFAVSGSCRFYAGDSREVSLFCPDPTVQIKSEGLRWPTDDVVFDNWWKATLNKPSADYVTLTFSHPAIALIVLS